jgi:hypothetical protein
MKNRTVCLVASFLCLLGLSGAKSETFTTPTTIIGGWAGFTTEMYGLASTNYSFLFSRDSFWLTKGFYNDVPVECVNSRAWREYAKGTLGRRGDTLILEGNYTDSCFIVNTGKQGVPNCGAGRTGVFTWRPRFVLSSEDTLYFKQEFQDIAFTRMSTGIIRKTAPAPQERLFFLKKGSGLAVRLESRDLPASIELFGVNGALLARKAVSASSMEAGMAMIGLPKTCSVYAVRVTTPHGQKFANVGRW